MLGWDDDPEGLSCSTQDPPLLLKLARGALPGRGRQEQEEEEERMEGGSGVPSPSQERRAEAAGTSSTSGLYPRGREPPGRKCLLSHRAGQSQEGEASGEESCSCSFGLLPLCKEDTGPTRLIRKYGVGSWKARACSSPCPPRSGYCQAEFLAPLPGLFPAWRCLLAAPDPNISTLGSPSALCPWQ